MKNPNSISVTIHPDKSSGEYLTATDALRQILDLIKVFESIEASVSDIQVIEWKLVNVYTNSPPFTIELEPNPQRDTLRCDEVQYVSVVTENFVSEWDNLTSDEPQPFKFGSVRTPLDRVLKRNLNGIAETQIIVIERPIVIDNKVALRARRTIRDITSKLYYPREIGVIQGTIHSLTKWHKNKPAIVIVDRVSGNKITCILNNISSKKIGEGHNWHEVWEGRHVDVTGTFFYTRLGNLSRVEVESIEETEWLSVELSDLDEIDITQGRTVAEHVALLRQELDE